MATYETTRKLVLGLEKALQCPICLSLLSNAVYTPCLHAFCKFCIERAIQFKGACPLCKTGCSKRQLSKVSAQLGGIVRSCKRLKKYVGMQLSASQNTSQSQMTSCDESPTINQARPRQKSCRQTSTGAVANKKRKLPITPAVTARTIETPAIISVTPQANGVSRSPLEKQSACVNFLGTAEPASRKKAKRARNNNRTASEVSSAVIVDLTTSGKNFACIKHLNSKNSRKNSSRKNSNAFGINATGAKYRKLKRSLRCINDSGKQVATAKHAKSKHSLGNRDPKMGAQAISEAPVPMKKKLQHKRTISATIEAVCDVCFDGESETNNEILFCDGCNVAVHQACYGVHVVPSGNWYCDWCSVNSGVRPNQECAVCPNKGGALKRCYSSQVSKRRRHQRNDKSRSWVHACCAVWMPELYYKDENNKRGVLGSDKIDKRRWNRRCVVCKKDSGACIQCASTDPYCAKWFHPYCSLKANLKHEYVENNSSQGIKLLAYCPHHGRAKENEQNIQTQEVHQESAEKQPHITSVTKRKSRRLSRSRAVVVLGTSLTASQQNKLKEFAEVINDVKLGSKFDPEVITHLVSRSVSRQVQMESSPPSNGGSKTSDMLFAPVRTLKYMKALMGNQFVVAFKWVTECLRQRKLVDEFDYLIEGDCSAHRCIGGTQTRLREMKTPLFWNCAFHLVGIFSLPCPPRADICDLIRKGGGMLLDDLSEFLHQHKCRTDIKHVVVCDSQRSPPAINRALAELSQDVSPLPMTTFKWVLDTISNGRLLDPNSHPMYSVSMISRRHCSRRL